MNNATYRLTSQLDILERKMSEVWPRRRPDETDSSNAGTGILFVVSLIGDGGADGDASTAATWTYTANKLDGTEMATEASPEVPREIGTRTAASKGIGYMDAGDVFHLLYAFETPGTGTCPA